ncbi:hypothetical protein DPMN_006992 [Dreissena polymorpha]|uniref:Uncharacterized protein n=1 Tax=Dreissena polymorpha TaxID=45954 RepID=A0A9D4MWI2_DREPO|nr:hypothetical protein DPMN_006992 [Dreissena polymorpha]
MKVAVPLDCHGNQCQPETFWNAREFFTIVDEVNQTREDEDINDYEQDEKHFAYLSLFDSVNNTVLQDTRL